MKLALLFAILLSGASANFSKSDPCDSFKVESQISGTQNPSEHQIQVTASGGSAPYKYIFLAPTGGPLSLDYDSNTLKYNKKGTIYCTVIDSNECQKKVKIEIK